MLLSALVKVVVMPFCGLSHFLVQSIDGSCFLFNFSLAAHIVVYFCLPKVILMGQSCEGKHW
jgi:hypothetical protein